MVKVKEVTSTENALVQRTILDQQRTYNEMVQITKQIRKVRALRIQTRTPKTFQKLVGWGVRNPLPWALVQTINGMIAKGTPQFERLPLNPDDPTERQSAAYLASTAWPLIQTYGRMHKVDYFYKLCDQLTGDGISITKLRRQYLANYPKPLKAPDQMTRDEMGEYNAMVAEYLANPRSPNPFSITQIDSATFWPDRKEEPEYTVEYGYKPLAPTLAALNLRQQKNGKIAAMKEDENPFNRNDVPRGQMFSDVMQPSGLGNNLLMAEVWTNDTCYVSMSGQVFKFENEFGMLPYDWRYGMTTSIPDPALERVSTVFPFFALDPYINTVLTGLLAWGIMASMPIGVITRPATASNVGDSTQGNVDLPLGQMVRLAPGELFDFKVPPNMGTEAVNVLNMMLSFYDRAGVTSMARGNIGTRTPGNTFTAALEAAGDMVMPIEKSLAGHLTDIVQKTWRAATTMNIPLNITGYSLADNGVKSDRSRFIVDPAMIDNYYDLECELQSFSDQEKMARGQFAALMIDKKLWSWERGAKYASVQNPEAERKAIALDTVYNSPEYQQLMIQGAIAADPMAAQAMVMVQAQQEAAMGGGLPPEGAPPPAAENGANHRPGMDSPMSGGGRAEGAPKNPSGPGAGGVSIPQSR